MAQKYFIMVVDNGRWGVLNGGATYTAKQAAEVVSDFLNRMDNGEIDEYRFMTHFSQQMADDGMPLYSWDCDYMDIEEVEAAIMTCGYIIYRRDNGDRFKIVLSPRNN